MKKKSEVVEEEVLKIDVLGTTYSIYKKDISEDPYFKNRDACGYCDMYLKKIVICNEESVTPVLPKDICEAMHKEALRHEIIHAFLYESGLNTDSLDLTAWATNEEMVDWLAIQLPKIYAVYNQLNLI